MSQQAANLVVEAAILVPSIAALAWRAIKIKRGTWY